MPLTKSPSKAAWLANFKAEKAAGKPVDQAQAIAYAVQRRARAARRADGGSVFDPRGDGYDYETARAAGLSADRTGHWPSRDPRTGVLLKGTAHPTWSKTLEGERAAGMDVYERDGRMYSRPRRAEGGEVSERLPEKPGVAPFVVDVDRGGFDQVFTLPETTNPFQEFKPPIEDRRPQARPVQKGILDNIIAHAVDLAKTPGYAVMNKFRRKPETPGQWSDRDEAMQQIYDQQLATRGVDLGLNMVGAPGLTGGVPGLGSGVSRVGRYNPLTDPERMSVAAEDAVRKRGAGIPTGKDAAGWDFRRPEAAAGSFEEAAQQAKAGFRNDVSAAREGYRLDTNPLMRAEDWDEMGKPGFVLGSGSRDKRAGAAPFFSALERAVEGAPQPRMTGEQWLGTLQNRPGVKPEELDWTGLRQYLTERAKAPVTQKEVTDHIAANRVSLTEVHKVPRRTVETGRTIFDDVDRMANEQFGRPYNALDDTQRRAVDESFKSRPGATKYHDYQLPGGENYREMLVTLPPAKKVMSDTEAKAIYDRVYKQGGDDWEKMTLRERQGWQDMFASQDSHRGVYKSSHWDEPNPLAHMRMNDREFGVPFTAEEMAALEARKGAESKIEAVRAQMNAAARDIRLASKPLEEARLNKIRDDLKSGKLNTAQANQALANFYDHPELKPFRDRLQALRAEEDALRASLPPEPKAKSIKSLHIEEIQSDWHQAGRKRGYTEPVEEAKGVHPDELKIVAGQYDWTATTPDGRTAKVGKGVERDEGGARDYLARYLNKQAAEKASAARIANADRVPEAPFKKTWHELGLKRALYEAAKNGYERLSWTPGAAQAARYDLSKQLSELQYLKNPDGTYQIAGTRTDGGGFNYPGNLSAEKLSDVVGKEMAEKIVKNEGKRARGQPANGGFFSGVDLQVGGEGMRGFYDKMVPQALEKIGKQWGVKVQQAPERAPAVGLFRDGKQISPDFPTAQEARRWAVDNAETRGDYVQGRIAIRQTVDEAPGVWYIDIPEQMRRDVAEQGFALFSGAKDKRAGAATLAADAHEPSLRPAIKVGERVYRAPEGGTHMDALSAVPTEQRQGITLDAANRGFINDRGRFLDREAAQQYAKDFGLIDPHAPSWAQGSRELIADNLRKTNELPPPAAAAERPVDPAAAGALPEQPAAALPGDGGGRLGGGDRGVAEAQATAERVAAGAKPLEGLPQKPLVVGDDYYVPGPIGQVRQIAEDYMKTTGREYNPPTRFYPVDKEHSADIAKAYDEMKHAPNDPAVKASYDALIDETVAQFKAMEGAGLKIEFIKPGMADPYAATPRLAARDVAENNHLWVFPTDLGYGTGGIEAAAKGNPMLRQTDLVVDGRKLLANDVFRIVHDYFGHLKEGHGFRAAGEDNAWRAHSAMYSDIARPAMTSETRGQNSWVNYGPHGETNRKASAADTTYADQKVGIMPEWTMRDRGSAEPIKTWHGGPHKFEKFDLSKVGSGEGEEVYGHGLYFAEAKKVGQHYRDILTDEGHQPLLFAGKPVDQIWNDGIRERFAGELKKLKPQQREDFVDVMSNLSMVQRMRQLPHVTQNFTPSQMKVFKDLIEPGLSRAPKNKGALYEVALDVDPQKLLDWDKIFKEQTPHVRQSLLDDLLRHQAERKESMGRALERGPKQFNKPLLKAAEEGRFAKIRENVHKSPEQLADEMTGRNVYRHMGTPALDQKEGYRKASAALNERGVPGMKYLDQVSRDLPPTSKAKRTSNFVIFDDKLVRILKRYGILLPSGAIAEKFMREQAQDEAPARATGGAISTALKLAHKINSKKGVHVGPIMSAVAGRTDHHPMAVPAGSYVLPADHVSSLGEGNTLAGMEVVNKMFRLDARTPKPRAAGGATEKPIEIMAAGGEVVIPPEKIAERFGDLDSGHAALDAWVVENRKHHIKTLSELPGPAQD